MRSSSLETAIAVRKFVGDAHRGEDQAQVTRNRTAEREESHAFGFKLELHLIDFGIAHAHSSREINIAVTNDIDDARDALFNHCAQGEQVSSQVDYARLQIDSHRVSFRSRVRQPKRPVT